MIEPRTYAWLVPTRLAVAERPGGGGRSHRRLRREAELTWWAAQGVTTVISGMHSRHGLLDAALAGFRVRWHPLVTTNQAVHEVSPLVDDVLGEMDRREGGVLVHVDLPGEWLAGVDAALRVALGLAAGRTEALAQAAEDGLPVGPVASALCAAGIGPARRARRPSRAR